MIYRYYKINDDSVTYTVWSRGDPFTHNPEPLPWSRGQIEDESFNGVVMIPVLL